MIFFDADLRLKSRKLDDIFKKMDDFKNFVKNSSFSLSIVINSEINSFFSSGKPSKSNL